MRQWLRAPGSRGPLGVLGVWNKKSNFGYPWPHSKKRRPLKYAYLREPRLSLIRHCLNIVYGGCAIYAYHTWSACILAYIESRELNIVFTLNFLIRYGQWTKSASLNSVISHHRLLASSVNPLQAITGQIPMHLPWKYGNTMHIISPNTKSRSNEPINVNGIQSTPNNISDTAKFSRNKLVMVRIRRFCTSVNMTRPLPITANSKMMEYNGICTRPDKNHVTQVCVAFAVELRDDRVKSTTVDVTP